MSLTEEHQYSNSETTEADGSINGSDNGGILQNATTPEDNLLEVGTSTNPLLGGKSLTQQRESRKHRLTNNTSNAEQEHNEDLGGMKKQDQLEEEDQCKSHSSPADLEACDNLPNWWNILSKKATELSKKQERRITHLVKIQAFRQAGLGWKLAKSQKMPEIVARHWAWWKAQRKDMYIHQCNKSFLELKRLAKNTGLRAYPTNSPKLLKPMAYKDCHECQQVNHRLSSERSLPPAGSFEEVVKNPAQTQERGCGEK
ncbi:hypothetical protein DFH27DRAFT_641319 [Peziza echinospora]|nr:hypothetical protein DFH27DRAFT_641319 [Peziza echinospora]